MLWSSRQAGISGIRLRVVLLCFGILAEFLSKVTKVVTESWKFHFHGFDTRSSKQVTYSNPQREGKKKKISINITNFLNVYTTEKRTCHIRESPCSNFFFT